MKSILPVLMCVYLMQTAAFAEESVSFAVSVTIPKVIEHSQSLDLSQDTKQADEESKDSKKYPWPEPVVIVKTIVNQP